MAERIRCSPVACAYSLRLHSAQIWYERTRLGLGRSRDDCQKGRHITLQLGARARAGVRFPPSLLVAESVSRLAGTHRSAGGYKKSTYLYRQDSIGDTGLDRSCKTGPECHRNAYTGTLSADARLAAHPTRSLGVI